MAKTKRSSDETHENASKRPKLAESQNCPPKQNHATAGDFQQELETAKINFIRTDAHVDEHAKNYVDMLEMRVEQLQAQQEAQMEQQREHLTCTICLELMQYPHVLGCGHSYCPDCLSQVFRATKRSCPSCRAPVERKPARNLALTSLLHLHVANLAQDERDSWNRRHEELVEEFGEGEQQRDAWHPHFQRQVVRALEDADDGVDRCGLCAWEIADGICENPECGQRYDFDGLAMEGGDAIGNESEWSEDDDNGDDLVDFLSDRSASPDYVSPDEDWEDEAEMSQSEPETGSESEEEHQHRRMARVPLEYRHPARIPPFIDRRRILARNIPFQDPIDLPDESDPEIRFSDDDAPQTAPRAAPRRLVSDSSESSDSEPVRTRKPTNTVILESSDDEPQPHKPLTRSSAQTAGSTRLVISDDSSDSEAVPLVKPSRSAVILDSSDDEPHKPVTRSSPQKPGSMRRVIADSDIESSQSESSQSEPKPQMSRKPNRTGRIISDSDSEDIGQASRLTRSSPNKQHQMLEGSESEPVEQKKKRRRRRNKTKRGSM